MAHHQSATIDAKNLYVKNLGEMTEQELYVRFAPFGQITSSVLMKTREGQSKGYGFVAFANEEAAAQAVKNMNNSIIAHGSDKRLYVSYAHAKEQQRSPRSDPQGPAALFVRNLSESVNESQLHTNFSRFGQILETNVRRHPSGISKRQGTIVFARQRDAQRALNEMNGRELLGCYIYLEFMVRPVEQPFPPMMGSQVYMQPLQMGAPMTGFPPTPFYPAPPPTYTQASIHQMPQMPTTMPGVTDLRDKRV